MPSLKPIWSQQARVYPYPLGAGSARPNPKMGAPDPENPLFLGFSVLRGGLRPWSETMVSEGARPWGRGRSGDFHDRSVTRFIASSARHLLVTEKNVPPPPVWSPHQMCLHSVEAVSRLQRSCAQKELTKPKFKRTLPKNYLKDSRAWLSETGVLRQITWEISRLPLAFLEPDCLPKVSPT